MFESLKFYCKNESRVLPYTLLYYNVCNFSPPNDIPCHLHFVSNVPRKPELTVSHFTVPASYFIARIYYFTVDTSYFMLHGSN